MYTHMHTCTPRTHTLTHVHTHTHRAAMEKMHSIYSQNPQLGDAKAVAASLEHTNGKLADLNSELDKFKVSDRNMHNM